MKKIFSLLTVLVLSMSMFADSYTIAFKSQTGTTDASNAITDASNIIESGAEYVSAIPTFTKVYNAKNGFGLKMGTSSVDGVLTLTLQTAVKPTSVVVRAASYNDTERKLTINTEEFELRPNEETSKTIVTLTKNYDGKTEISELAFSASPRCYLIDVTVNYTPATGGDDAPEEPAACYEALEWLPNGSGNDANTDKYKLCKPEVEGVGNDNIQQPGWAAEAGIYVTFPAAPITACSLGDDKYAVQGAGAIIYVSAFTKKVTEFTVTANNVDYAFTAFYADGTEGDVPPVVEDTTATVHVANTLETAYTTAEIKAIVDDKKSILTDSVYVKGVVGTTAPVFNSQYGSMTYYLDNDAFQVHSGMALDSAKFTAATDLEINDTVIVKGVAKLYNTTYELDRGNYLVELKKYNKPATDTTATVNIANTQAEAYTVSKALELLADKKSILTDSVYVMGTVKAIKEISVEYGNAEFTITDGEKDIVIFRVKDLGNVKFTDEKAFKVGDKVVVKGLLKVYNSTDELTSGYLVSLTRTGYFIKHPWGTGKDADWTWQMMSDTTYLEKSASFYLGAWGNNGFNIAIDENYDAAAWIAKDAIKVINSKNPLEEAVFPELGTKVLFVYLHESDPLLGQAFVVLGVTTALDENGAEVTCQKVLIEGKVYILRGEHLYNISGAMVK